MFVKKTPDGAEREMNKSMDIPSKRIFLGFTLGTANKVGFTDSFELKMPDHKD